MTFTRNIGASRAVRVLLLFVFALVSHPGNTEVRLRTPAAVPPGTEEQKPPGRVRIGPDLAEELKCLALNIYFEARSEAYAGQVAVAMVTLNRTAHPRFPNTICGVVRQGGDRSARACQFSWYCDGRKDIPANAQAWQRSQDIARRVVFQRLADPTGGAMWYHANYVRPKWAKRLRQTTRIGRHVYYAEG